MIDLTLVILCSLIIIVGGIFFVYLKKKKEKKVMEAKYCKKCGKEINEPGKFCSECGTPIGASEFNGNRISTPQTSKSTNSGLGWLITIIGIVTFFISLLLRGTPDYGYGQYPWMAQASFASSVDLAFNISILLIAVGLVLVVISHIKKS